MKFKKLIAMLLVATTLLSLMAIGSFAATWTEDTTVTSASESPYGSRYSTNRDDWFAEGAFVEADSYVMPDRYNTGHVTPYEDLVDFGVKYPNVEKSTGTNGAITYTIQAATAKKYNYVFEGFKIENGCIRVLAQGDTVVIRDFFIDSQKNVGSSIWTPRKIEVNGHPNKGEYYNGRTIALDGEIVGSNQSQISGFNITVRRCYMHHCQADHVKGFSGQVLVGNLIVAGGLNGGNPHPDCIQYSVDDGHGKGLATENVYVYGNRFDIPKTKVNATNAVIMLKSEFGGGLRNVNICKNWMNGGGVSVQVFYNTDYATGMQFYENININDNVFGTGEQYRNTHIMWGKDKDGVSLQKKTTATGNATITSLYAGSVVYFNDGERIFDLADATGTLSVRTVIANYVNLSQRVMLKVDIVNAQGAVIATKYQSADIERYAPHSEYTGYDNYTDLRYADFPVNKEVNITLDGVPALTEGCQAQVTVFTERPDGSLEPIRIDSLTYHDAPAKTVPVSVPNGYTLYDTNANSPSNLFKQAVAACSGKKGEALREALLVAASYYPDVDEGISGVTEAKAQLDSYIATYNNSISANNDLMESGLNLTAKFNDISSWFRDVFEGFFAFVRRLFSFI